MDGSTFKSYMVNLFYHFLPLQIELDLLRTLPNNKHYDGPHADGIAKLRRILLAYSVHNPEVEYCQVCKSIFTFHRLGLMR